MNKLHKILSWSLVLFFLIFASFSEAATVTLNSAWLSNNADDWNYSDNQAGGNLDSTPSSIYFDVDSNAFNSPPVEFTIYSVSGTPFNLDSLRINPLDNNDYRLEIYPTGNYAAKVTSALVASQAGQNIDVTTNLLNITSFTVRFLDVIPGPDIMKVRQTIWIY